MPYYKTPDYALHFLDDEVDLKTVPMFPQDAVQITDEEADAIRIAALHAPTYTELRAAAYPPITDYIDGWVKGDIVQMQAYANACLEVKAKYPK